jgi:hypothetical protein
MGSSGMLHSVDLMRTDVSGELSPSIIRVTIGELGTLVVTGNQPTSNTSSQNASVTSYG